MWRKLLSVVLLFMFLFCVLVCPAGAFIPAFAAVPLGYEGLCCAVAVAGGIGVVVANDDSCKALAQYIWDVVPSARDAIASAFSRGDNEVFLSSQTQYELIAAHKRLEAGDVGLIHYQGEGIDFQGSLAYGDTLQLAEECTKVMISFEVYQIVAQVGIRVDNGEFIILRCRYGDYGEGYGLYPVVRYPESGSDVVIGNKMPEGTSTQWVVSDNGLGGVEVKLGGLTVFELAGVSFAGQLVRSDCTEKAQLMVTALGGSVSAVNASEAIDLGPRPSQDKVAPRKMKNLPGPVVAGGLGAITAWMANKYWDWDKDDPNFDPPADAPDYSPAGVEDMPGYDSSADSTWLSGIWTALQNLIAQVGSLVRALNIVNMLQAVRAAVIEWVIPSPDFFPGWAATFAAVWDEKFGGYAGAFGALRDAFAAEGAAPKWYVAGHLMIDFADYESLYSKIRVCLGGFISALTVVWVLRTFKPRQTID